EQQGRKITIVGRRPLACDSGKDEVALAINGQPKLREASQRNGALLPVFSGQFASLGVVAAGRSGFETAGVQSDPAWLSLQLAGRNGSLDCLTDQVFDTTRSKQAVSCFLNGRPVRRVSQLDRLAQCR